jgi:hypothetical protein
MGRGQAWVWTLAAQQWEEQKHKRTQGQVGQAVGMTVYIHVEGSEAPLS